MIVYILKNGLKSHAYTLRAKILDQYYETKESNFLKNMYVLDCNTEAGWLCIRLFEHYPSFIEKATCHYELCNYEKYSPGRGYLVEDSKLNAIDLNDLFQLGRSYCQKCETQESVVHVLESIGKIF